MKKIRFKKLLKISVLLLCILLAVIITVAFFDPNLKSFLLRENEFTADIIDDSEETEGDDSSQITKPSKTESEPSSSKKPSKESNDEDKETNNIILQKPNYLKGDETCTKCRGDGVVTCPSCNGTGMGLNSVCGICYGNGKIQCQYCK